MQVAFSLSALLWDGVYTLSKITTKQRKENNMGALIMFAMVIIIANVGGFYFLSKDRKDKHATSK